MSPQRIASTIRREVPSLRDDERLARRRRAAHRGRRAGAAGRRRRAASCWASSASASSSARCFRATSRRSATPASSRVRSTRRWRSAARAPTSRSSKHMNTDHIDVGEDFSDIQLAEIFLHHRVLIIPIVDGDRVTGIVTREDFFRALAQRLLEPPVTSRWMTLLLMTRLMAASVAVLLLIVHRVTAHDTPLIVAGCAFTACRCWRCARSPRCRRRASRGCWTGSPRWPSSRPPTTGAARSTCSW